MVARTDVVGIVAQQLLLQSADAVPPSSGERPAWMHRAAAVPTAWPMTPPVAITRFCRRRRADALASRPANSRFTMFREWRQRKGMLNNGTGPADRTAVRAVDAGRRVQINGPATVWHASGKVSPRCTPVFEDVLANKAAALTLTGKEADPVECPVRAGRVLAAVFDMVPQAERCRQELVAERSWSAWCRIRRPFHPPVAHSQLA